SIKAIVREIKTIINDIERINTDPTYKAVFTLGESLLNNPLPSKKFKAV
ncbi:MAG: hypothetical protein GXO45_03000, partial [Aquificae bacterium]|nr:hypothetical protein [Aquificota bacterium]